MPNLFTPVVLITTLSLGSSTFAATSPPAAAHSGPSATALRHNTSSKRDACANSWRKQTMHVGTRVVFMKACVSKG